MLLEASGKGEGKGRYVLDDVSFARSEMQF
jgi:hypothetical protein